MTLKVDAIRGCLEGVIPATMATASPDGTPNVAYLSQVQYVDSDHVALSYQFFNKTRQNLMANPHAVLAVIDPVTVAHYRLTLEYLRTETAGPLFESMKAKLAGIASHVGMSGVFRLLGSDVFRVHAIEAVSAETLPAPLGSRNLLAALRATSETLRACADLECLLADTLLCLERSFDIRHAMLLMLDGTGQRLYTVASRGYETSGVGSEIALGDGVIGVAARERTPIRIGHMNAEYGYNRAIRASTVDTDLAAELETEIPLPGLPDSRSQLAVPICCGTRLHGVLYVESQQDLRFSYDDEDALVTIAGQLGAAMQLLQTAEAPDERPDRKRRKTDQPVDATAATITVRHYRENDSIFLNDDYLIKGVAGSIFWTLLRDYSDKQRVEFTNRELRLDPRIRLPDTSDNLEARLILLSRRLLERSGAIRIDKTGRGRFRLQVDSPLRLSDE